MKFSFTTLYGKDMDETISFHSDLAGTVETPGVRYFLVKGPNGLNVQFEQRK